MGLETKVLQVVPKIGSSGISGTKFAASVLSGTREKHKKTARLFLSGGHITYTTTSVAVFYLVDHSLLELLSYGVASNDFPQSVRRFLIDAMGWSRL